METENNSKGKNQLFNDADVAIGMMLIGGFVAFAIVMMIFLLIIYSAVFAMCGGAIYLGVKLGSHGQVGLKKPYERIHDLNEQQREHLANLEDESEDLRQLAESHFEDQKLDLYRPKDEQRPGMNLEKAKEVAKKIIDHLK